MGEVWASDAIALNFLKKLDSTDCSMWVQERLDFYSWFLAILKEFSGLPLFRLIFFLKIKWDFNKN